MEKDKLSKVEAAKLTALRKAGKAATKTFTRKLTGMANGVPLPEVPHTLMSVKDSAEKTPVCRMVGQTVVCTDRNFKGTVSVEYISMEAFAAFSVKLKALYEEELAK